MCKLTFNRLIRLLRLILSTKPIWDICIIWYFSSAINSEIRRSNETLVGVEIPNSNLQDRTRTRYQLNYAASLVCTILLSLFTEWLYGTNQKDHLPNTVNVWKLDTLAVGNQIGTMTLYLRKRVWIWLQVILTEKPFEIQTIVSGFQN